MAELRILAGEYENIGQVIDWLRSAEDALTKASQSATEAETAGKHPRTGLQGNLGFTIGGLAQAAGSLADLIETKLA